MNTQTRPTDIYARWGSALMGFIIVGITAVFVVNPPPAPSAIILSISVVTASIHLASFIHRDFIYAPAAVVLVTALASLITGPLERGVVVALTATTAMLAVVLVWRRFTAPRADADD